MEQFVFPAESRTQIGSKPSRMIRARGRIPGNIYGHKEANVLISIDYKEFAKFLGAGHRFLTLRIGQKDESSVVKEVQYDHLGSTIVHVDFSRVSRDEKVEVVVPIETVGIPKGLSGGGVLDFPMKEVSVSGFPQDLPEHITVNIESLELGHAIRLKDLPTPPRCVFVGNPESVILTVVHQQVEAPVAPVEGAPAQPEVIARKKDEEPEEGAEPDAKKKEK